MSRKICFITGSRAEYGLVKNLMQKVVDDPSLEFQLVVTGAHLSLDFGLTYREIELDGFLINHKIDILKKTDSATSISDCMGRAMIGFGAVYDLLKPDILIVLGDRYEIFSAVAVALIAKIPVAHIHGGEKTEGAFDDALRNAITKMSHLHFVAANEYEKRVIQLGEQPDRVFNVGGLGVDNVSSMPLLERTKIEEILGVTFFKKNLLVTYHPETLSASDPTKQMEVLLSVLSELRDTRLIFTFSNPDPFGLNFIKIIEDFVKTHDNAKIFSSLGSECYLSCLAEVDGVVGNSSSGILEAPSLKTGTINIGDRQRGRLLADSIIQTEPTKKAIKTAIDRLYSKEFQGLLATVESPFGVGGAGDRILNIVRDVRLENLVKKSFYDLHIESLNS